MNVNLDDFYQPQFDIEEINRPEEEEIADLVRRDCFTAINVLNRSGLPIVGSLNNNS